MNFIRALQQNTGLVNNAAGAREAGHGPGANLQSTVTADNVSDLNVKTDSASTYRSRLDAANSFEDILHATCGFGRWQDLLILYMSVMWLILPFFSMSMIYIGASPPFKCADGFDIDNSYDSLPDNTTRCVQYDNSSATCTRWVWSDAIYKTTAVTEWSLVCERKPLLPMLQTILMVGALVGALVAGQLADRFGRRPVVLAASALIVAMGFALVAATDYSLFLACRFFAGFAMALMIGSQYVVVVELTTARVRAFMSSVSFFPFIIGNILVAVGSYWIRSRRLLQLAYAIPSLAFIPNIWLIPESPRWLAQHGREQEASNMLERACRWNGRAPPPRDALLRALSRLNLKDSGVTTNTEQLRWLLRQMVQLVQTPRMRIYVLISTLAYFVATASYFGIAFDATQLSDDPHLTGVLVAIVDIPSVIFYPIINWFGRKKPTAGFFLLAAVSMLLVPFVHSKSGILALGLIGKLGISIAFNNIYTYVPEFLPTSHRATAFGVCQVGGRIGACVSPFVVDLLSILNPSAPSLVFGAFALVTGLAFLWLPETKGMRMPATVQEVEQGLVPEIVPESNREDASVCACNWRCFLDAFR